MFDGLASSAMHIKAGRIKALAVAAPQRAPGFPEIPTTAEARRAELRRRDLVRPVGAKDAEGGGRGHARRPRQGTRQRRVAQGLERPRRRDARSLREAFGKFVNTEIKRWAEVVKSSGTKLD